MYMLTDQVLIRFWFIKHTRYKLCDPVCSSKQTEVYLSFFFTCSIQCEC